MTRELMGKSAGQRTSIIGMHLCSQRRKGYIPKNESRTERSGAKASCSLRHIMNRNILLFLIVSAWSACCVGAIYTNALISIHSIRSFIRIPKNSMERKVKYDPVALDFWERCSEHIAQRELVYLASDDTVVSAGMPNGGIYQISSYLLYPIRIVPLIDGLRHAPPEKYLAVVNETGYNTDRKRIVAQGKYSLYGVTEK